MAENNVVQLPGTTKEDDKSSDMTREEMQKIIARGQEIQLTKIDEDRVQGLERVDRALISLDDPTYELDPERSTEARLRDLEGAVRGLATATSAINNLVDVTKHDLINMIGNLEELSRDLWRKGAHLQTLIEVLEDKELLNEKELKDKWDTIVPIAIEALKKEATSEKK